MVVVEYLSFVSAFGVNFSSRVNSVLDDLLSPLRSIFCCFLPTELQTSEANAEKKRHKRRKTTAAAPATGPWVHARLSRLDSNSSLASHRQVSHRTWTFLFLYLLFFCHVNPTSRAYERSYINYKLTLFSEIIVSVGAPLKLRNICIPLSSVRRLKSSIIIPPFFLFPPFFCFQDISCPSLVQGGKPSQNKGRLIRPPPPPHLTLRALGTKLRPRGGPWP